MNKFTIILSILLLAGMATNAQNNQGKADDGERIAITPQVSDQEIPNGAKNMLLTKMKQIASLNGLSGDGENPFFIMDASVDILTKELTPTAPPMHALNLQITFFIGDNINDNVYSETSMEVKGVGKNETKAYIAAIKNINTRQGQFKAFVERGKNKIMEFYNSDCDFVISRAKALQQQGNNGEAIRVLNSVPKVSKECYDKCMEILAEIEPPADEPMAMDTDNGGQGSSSPTSGGGQSTMIDEGIYLVYMGGKQMGDKTILHFEFQNRGTDDYELNDYSLDTRCVDGSGDEFSVEKVTVAGKSGSRAIATIMPGTPVAMDCEFEKMKSVAMFEYKYKGRIYRLKDLTIGAVASSSSASSGAAAVSSSSGDYANTVEYDGAKVIFNKTTKWGTLKLPVDKFGNQGGPTAYEGKVIRYLFSAASENNPEYILRQAEKSLEAKGYEIVLSLKNENLGQFFPDTYFNKMGNHVFGTNRRFFQCSNQSYLLAKKNIDGAVNFVALYIYADKGYTGINQDVIIVGD